MNPPARRAIPIDLLSVLVAGCLTALILFGFPGAIALRAALGLPFLILGPGYALTSALFPREPPERSMLIALTLGLSIVAMVLSGLVLNAVGIGLTAHALALALVLIAAGGCAVAALRRAPEASPPKLPGAAVLRSPWLWSSTVLLVVFAVLLALLARPLPDPKFAGYTQLSALRTAGTGIRASVRSAEHSRTSYRLLATTASGRVLAREFSLTPGQEWTGILPTGAPREQTVHVRLYRAGDPAAVYREVIPRA